MKSRTLFAIAFNTFGLLTSAQGALLFYEDFEGFTAGGASLDGQGGWNSPDDSANVQTGVFFGGVNGEWDGTIGGSVTSGGNFLARIGDAFGDIALSPSVTGSFVDGTTTWFGYIEYNGNGGANGRQNVAIGAAPLTVSGGLEMDGEGIGVGTESANKPRAAFWVPNEDGDDENTAESTIGSGRPILVLAKIQWGDLGDDVITVKRFAFSIPEGLSEADWDAISEEVSEIRADLDQSTFDTLSFANGSGFMDDIRIASDFDSAVSGTEVTILPSNLFGDLSISPNVANPGNYDFEWASREGKLYDLVSATNLDTAPDTWEVWNENANMTGAPETTILLNVEGGAVTRRFFAVIEKDQ